MSTIHRIEDLIDELDMLKSYGVTVSEAAYTAAREVDLRLLSLLDRRDAALLVLRRAASTPASHSARKTSVR